MFLFKPLVKAKLQKMYKKMKRHRDQLAMQRDEGYIRFDTASRVILQVAEQLKIKLEV